MSTATESREINKLATFVTAVDGVAAAAGPPAVELGVDDPSDNGGSGGSAISLLSNGGNGGSVCGLTLGGAICNNAPTSAGKITYKFGSRSAWTGRHGHA